MMGIFEKNDVETWNEILLGFFVLTISVSLFTDRSDYRYLPSGASQEGGKIIFFLLFFNPPAMRAWRDERASLTIRENCWM